VLSFHLVRRIGTQNNSLPAVCVFTVCLSLFLTDTSYEQSGN
jgi:hypothetical protein